MNSSKSEKNYIKRRKLTWMESTEHPSVLFPQGSVEVSRMMTPDDTNLAGNVHGGTVLRMIEEAGGIIATRHCNKNRHEGKPAVWAALARVEQTNFVKPMYVGELATVHADLTYSSKHSLEVQVLVFAENLVKGEHKLCNKACLWYVPVEVQSVQCGESKVSEVPPLEYKSKEDEEAGRRRYEAQLISRKTKEELLSKIPCGIQYPISGRNHGDLVKCSVEYSASSLTHSVQPSDCNIFKYCNGGVTMKMMDNVAGMVAFRHAHCNIVTASIDAIDFHNPVKLGEIMTITGRMTFTSDKSMEIKVVADVENLLEGRCFRALSAFFYFVALDKSGYPIKVPALQPQTEEEKQRFEEGRARYNSRKQRRMSNK
ncbi:cytosolic acyl coenzyme A thioester hydrolase-like [Dendronephthya gigantea]|uniref:cytosolic acyl coenzyme A thioester hydrolase-like n=1 Tax=Dendronephthya gigantea TaxID=151771 RepID=UPI00106D1D3C|nr:cytosolic acyl coenzyme A thioester hydrolase-like [Dendronephthya gigantea]